MIGVLLHACIAFAVLDDGKTAETPRRQPAAPVGAAPTATPLPDRTSCAEIRNTIYRSEAERQWYLSHCT